MIGIPRLMMFDFEVDLRSSTENGRMCPPKPALNQGDLPLLLPFVSSGSAASFDHSFRSNFDLNWHHIYQNYLQIPFVGPRQ